MRVTLYSKIFLETDDDTWSARPSNSLMQRLHSGEGSARWIACISDSYISLGDPITSDGYLLYLPQWFMDSVGAEPGLEIEIDFQKSEEMPRATSLTFRMMGSSYDLDIRDLLEEPLSQLGVLQVGQIIPVPTLEGMLILESCEPDGVVFLDGAEIALNILEDSTPNSFVASPPNSFVASPPNSFVASPAHAPDSFDLPMIPTSAPAKTTSRFPPKFIPFQGAGNRLG